MLEPAPPAATIRLDPRDLDGDQWAIAPDVTGGTLTGAQLAAPPPSP